MNEDGNGEGVHMEMKVLPKREENGEIGLEEREI